METRVPSRIPDRDDAIVAARDFTKNIYNRQFMDCILTQYICFDKPPRDRKIPISVEVLFTSDSIEIHEAKNKRTQHKALTTQKQTSRANSIFRIDFISEFRSTSDADGSSCSNDRVESTKEEYSW